MIRYIIFVKLPLIDTTFNHLVIIQLITYHYYFDIEAHNYNWMDDGWITNDTFLIFLCSDALIHTLAQVCIHHCESVCENRNLYFKREAKGKLVGVDWWNAVD